MRGYVLGCTYTWAVPKVGIRTPINTIQPNVVFRMPASSALQSNSYAIRAPQVTPAQGGASYNRNQVDVHTGRAADGNNARGRAVRSSAGRPSPLLRLRPLLSTAGR